MTQRPFAFLALALFLPASALAQAGAADEVVATVGEASITRGDLEKTVKAQLIEIDNQRYEVLENGLNNMISEKLLAMEAEASGKSLEDFQQEIMSAPVDEPSDDVIQKVYDENKEQLGGKSLEEVKGRIVEFLKNQERAQKAQALLASLREKHPTTIKLSPPVIDVSDAGRTSRGGGADAPVTIVAFSDYECPYCKKGEEVIGEVMAAYGDKVRYVHRDYPLPFHQNARKAAEAARCAGEQDKFWEAYDGMFAADALNDEKIAEIVVATGIDQTKYDACMTEGRTKAMVEEDMTAGGEVGVSGTPAFFVNGRMLSGAQPLERFKEIIDAELAKSAAN